jgi:hypothetical protein
MQTKSLSPSLQKKTKAKSAAAGKGASGKGVNKAGKKSSTPKGKGSMVARVKTPTSVKGGVKKGKGKAMPMSIDAKPIRVGRGRGDRRGRGEANQTRVVMKGGRGIGSGLSSQAGVGQRRINRAKIRGETGNSINSRFEKINREKGSSKQKQSKGRKNSFGVVMPF